MFHDTFQLTGRNTHFRHQIPDPATDNIVPRLPKQGIKRFIRETDMQMPIQPKNVIHPVFDEILVQSMMFHQLSQNHLFLKRPGQHGCDLHQELDLILCPRLFLMTPTQA